MASLLEGLNGDRGRSVKVPGIDFALFWGTREMRLINRDV